MYGHNEFERLNIIQTVETMLKPCCKKNPLQYRVVISYFPLLSVNYTNRSGDNIYVVVMNL